MQKRKSLKLSSFILTLILSSITLHLNGQITVIGKMIDAETGEALISANVVVKGTTKGTVTDVNGNYSITVNQETPFVLIFSYTGYTSQEVEVTDATTVSVQLVAGITGPDLVIITASYEEESRTDAPVSNSVIGKRRIENMAVIDPSQYLKNTVGVSVSEQSAGRMSINLRGQVSTFFTGLYVARDYKPLTQPGNGTFFSTDHSLSTLDMKRIEIVRGPGSALYGPGVTNGVVHFITKNPFDDASTSIELGLNTVNTFGGFGYSGAVRHAGHNEKRTIGYKINAYYKYSDEWEYDIYNDPDLANTLGRMRGVDVIASAVDQTPLVTDILSDGLQDYFRNYNIDGAVYFKNPDKDANLVLAGGYTKTDQVWLTTNNIGLRRPTSFFTQARGNWGNTFANISFTSNKTGDETNNLAAFYRASTRDANDVRNIALTQAEQYEFTEAQLQQRFSLDFKDTEILVGGEARFLNIGGGIFGRNTGNTPYNLAGAYTQIKSELTDNLDLTLALRYDYYSVLQEGSVAPRVALVYQPNDNGAFRASFNQAYTAPSGINFYLDLDLGPVTDDMGNFMSWIRLVGGATELHTFDNPTIDWGGTANDLGVTNGLTLSHADAIIAAASAAGVTVDVSNITSSTDLNTNIVNTGHNTATLVNATPLKLQNTSTYEIGYFGKITDKLTASIDLYYNDINNAQAVNTDYSRFISNTGLADAVKGSAASLGLSSADLDSLNVAIDAIFAGNKVGAVLSDIQLDDEVTAAGRAGAPYTFRQYFSAATVNYFGYDIHLEYQINDELDIALDYSGLSKTEFEDNGLRYLLNTPQNRVRGSVGYTRSKFSALFDFQWQQAFEILNGTFSGLVDARTTFDLSLGYKFDEHLGITLTCLNLLDNEYQAFPGSFKIGRQLVMKARYDL